MATLSRTERIDLRVTEDFKRQVQEAAALASMSVSEYMIAKVYQAALSDLKDHRLQMWSEAEIEAASKLLEAGLVPIIDLKSNRQALEDERQFARLEPLRLKFSGR